MAIRERKQIKTMVLAAMFLAMALLLPLVTGQIPQIGKMLSPMHFPVLLCGFFCGPVFGMIVGVTAPILRSMIFGMPAMMPDAFVMTFELAAYGFFAGMFYRLLPKTKLNLYLSLIGAMIGGRIVWGVVRAVLTGFGYSEFGWGIFVTVGFMNALPGIVLQIVLIPIIVMFLNHESKQVER